MSFDLVVIGSGIVGLACALAGHRRGRKVTIIDKDDHCVGASIRNFGFVTVTGQGSGLTWNRAMASRNTWAQIVEEASLEVAQRGLIVLAQRDEAVPVLRALCKTKQGQDLVWLDEKTLRAQYPMFDQPNVQGALVSPHELRFEARLVIHQIRQWLVNEGVQFWPGQLASLTSNNQLLINGEPYSYRDLVIAPGPDVRGFAPELTERIGLRTCRLSMLRVRPPDGYRLPAPVMSDLSLIRYRGYAELPESIALKIRLEQEQSDYLAHGIHLIVVQSTDGTLVVGDSHHYGSTIDPFAQAKSESLILNEMQSVLHLSHYEVIERWVGYYPSANTDAIIHPLGHRTTLVSVTSGTGMSTSFALAEEWANERL